MQTFLAKPQTTQEQYEAEPIEYQTSRKPKTTTLTHIAPVKHYHTSFTKVAIVKILPKEADQEKKATLGGTFDCHIILHGKEIRLGG